MFNRNSLDYVGSHVYNDYSFSMYHNAIYEYKNDAVLPCLSRPVAPTPQPSHGLTHLWPILAPTPLRFVSNLKLRKQSQRMPCPLLRQGLRHTAPTRAATGAHAELVGIDIKLAQRVRGDIALWRVVFAHPRWNEGKRESEVSEARAVLVEGVKRGRGGVRRVVGGLLCRFRLRLGFSLGF